MYYPPPVRGRPVLAGKKVLLIDRCQATCQVRAAVLRSHGVEVHAAEEISAARFLWQPNIYDLVMLDVRRYSPWGDARILRADQASKSPGASCLSRWAPKLPFAYLAR